MAEEKRGSPLLQPTDEEIRKGKRGAPLCVLRQPLTFRSTSTPAERGSREQEGGSFAHRRTRRVVHARAYGPTPPLSPSPFSCSPSSAWIRSLTANCPTHGHQARPHQRPHSLSLASQPSPASARQRRQIKQTPPLSPHVEVASGLIRHSLFRLPGHPASFLSTQHQPTPPAKDSPSSFYLLFLTFSSLVRHPFHPSSPPSSSANSVAATRLLTLKGPLPLSPLIQR